MTISILIIREDISESDFPKLMYKRGYKCVRLSMANFPFINNKLNTKLSFGIGMPDYFVFNDKDSFLCEFKSKNDGLKNEQVLWAINNSHLPITWALVVLNKINVGSLDLKIKCLEECKNTKKTTKKQFIQNLRNDILERYLAENPRLVGNSILLTDNGNYYGGIPEEIWDIWQNIDKLMNAKSSIKSIKEYAESLDFSKLKCNTDSK